MKSVFDFWQDFFQNGAGQSPKNWDCAAQIGTYGKPIYVSLFVY